MSAGEGHSASFFSFATSCLLLALSCPYHPVVSYRLRSVEALRGWRRGVGRYASAGRRRDFGFSSLVPSSRLALRLVRFPRIGLRAGCVRRFLLAHSPASFRGGWSYRFPFRLVPRLACPSRVGVSCLFFAVRSSIRFISSICRCLVVPSRSAIRLLFLRPARRSSVSCLARLIVSHRLARRLVKQSVFSFRPAACRAGWVLSFRSFCSRLISLVAVSWPWGRAAARLAIALWLCVSFPVAILHRGAVAIAEMGVPFDDTEGRAVLFSSFSPSGRGMK